MANCYLTGVQFPLSEGYVLNRRDAHHLLRTLKDRINSLQRVVDQLSPLDKIPGKRQCRGKSAYRKRHRLVCRAIAEVLAPGYPEISLFLPWIDYRKQIRLMELRRLLGHPLYGNAVGVLAEKSLLQAVDLGNRVVRMLDPHNKIPHQVRTALKAGVCVRHHDANATELLQMIRLSIEENSNLCNLGVPEEMQEDVRRCLSRLFSAEPGYCHPCCGDHDDESVS